ncbi:potassium voltage-gated channel protein Shaw-like isoform X2 [Xenia sp. Carnegie-2017]|uniref:potassium voltage-gated channel protein Shaw-like isoform X2 n=1 Tax=Xenia sp. Carnegie-2017 TaxID=2897299 RepID=UPI001F033600|nr:potassium voltage-gated channel protein Shaw-like isoform X2 [Xenia sp. Carnegie-2017]
MSKRTTIGSNDYVNQNSDDLLKVILNVGGQKHETRLSTLNNFTDTRLSWIRERVVQDRRPNREFFFDRHPGMFSHILNYFRTGKLHAPRDICGPMFEEELSFWGINPKLIEPCCWSYYDEHNELEEKLRDFGPMDDKESFVECPSDEEEKIENIDDIFKDDCETKKHEPSRLDKRTKQLKKSWNKCAKFVWKLLEKPKSSKWAWVFSLISLILAFVVVILFWISTLVDNDTWHILYLFEKALISWFSFEFVARLLTCPDKKSFLKLIQTWLDVMAFLPFYLILAFPYEGLRVLKLLYVLRFYRAFRAYRFSYVLQVFIKTLMGSLRELFLLFFIFSTLVVTYGSLAYYAEKNHNKHFSSIPASFWWSLITMTTVGYGDITPTTLYGKLVGGACALSGVLMMALPVSVVASNFSLYNNYAKVKMKLPKRVNKKIINSDLHGLQFATPENSLSNDEQQNYNGRRRSFRSRSRYSSVISTLEEEDYNQDSEIETVEMTKRQKEYRSQS